jgi:hypothetical protein
MVGHLGTPSLKWAQAVQEADFGILHMMLVLGSAECKKYGVIEASIEI